MPDTAYLKAQLCSCCIRAIMKFQESFLELLLGNLSYQLKMLVHITKFDFSSWNKWVKIDSEALRRRGDYLLCSISGATC